MPERGARIARREKRAYWAYVSDEQRREAGCPVRQTVVIQRGQPTRATLARAHFSEHKNEADRVCTRCSNLAVVTTSVVSQVWAERLASPVAANERP